MNGINPTKPSMRARRGERSDIPQMPEAEAVRRARAEVKEARRAQSPQAFAAVDAAAALKRQAFEEAEYRFFTGQATREEVEEARAARDEAETEQRRRLVLARHSREQVDTLSHQENVAVKAFGDAIRLRNQDLAREARELLRRAIEINDRLREDERVAEGVTGGRAVGVQSCWMLTEPFIRKWAEGE